MNAWDEAELAAQFRRVLASRWIDIFENAASATGSPTELLLAIASRETNIRNILGDFRGSRFHGFGIMQIDLGTDPEFCAAWSEAKVAESIGRGAEILGHKRAYLVSQKGLAVTHAAIAAAYNTGEGNVARSLRAGLDPDSTTTGANYGRDVVARMHVFGRLLREFRSQIAHTLEAFEAGTESKAA